MHTLPPAFGARLDSAGEACYRRELQLPSYLGCVVLCSPSSYGNAMELSETLARIRQEYTRAALEEEHLPLDPLLLLEQWLQEAIAADVPEPTAMVLATATPDGCPSARVMLLKGLEEGALVFYTNYESRKAAELAANPRAAAVLFWAPLERQVRVEGSVERLSAEQSAQYFATRPQGGSAWGMGVAAESDNSEPSIPGGALPRACAALRGHARALSAVLGVATGSFRRR
jgi:pyridoxine/pyridoxamine 5'-phosphate oxidase